MGERASGPSRSSFSIVTNASRADGVRLRHTVPSWSRTFPRAAEILIVVDTAPPSGRIAELHGQGSGLSDVYEVLEVLRRLDSRLRHIELDLTRLGPTSRKWFRPPGLVNRLGGEGTAPYRCQAGTPIFAFVQAVEEAAENLVLRTDCDMLFHENGFIDRAADLLSAGRADLVEPMRLGWRSPYAVSSRAFLVRKTRLEPVLPLTAHRLDLPRRLHRAATGRPPWLALEKTLEMERRRGRIAATMLPEPFGFSMHVATHQQASLPWFDQVPAWIERGEVPPRQRLSEMDFDPDAWAPVLSGPTT